MSYNGPLWLNLVGSWVPRTSPHPRDTIRTPSMLEVARIRSRTSSDTFLSRFPPFFLTCAQNENERDGAGLRISVAAATPSQLRRRSDSVAAPSQQRLRRSSVAAALRAASAPSQQHQLRRGRDAQNERDRASLRISVAAATPSQLRRSGAARTMSGRRGIGQSSPSGNFATFWAKTGVQTLHNLVSSTLFSLKSLGHSPARDYFFGVIKKSTCLGSEL